jgi:Zn-dependent protease
MDLLAPAVDLTVLGAAVVLHEVGHGAVAYRCGDPTAAEQGRLTLNPLRHVDPIGTVLLPLLLGAGAWLAGVRPLLFGWAKPVPVDPRRMRNPRRDMALVAAAGPTINVVLGMLSAGALVLLYVHLPDARSSRLADAARMSVRLNCVLAVLNLLPIPPLDGGRIFAALAPRAWRPALAQVERYGLLIVVLVISSTPVLPWLVAPVITAMLALGVYVVRVAS